MTMDPQDATPEGMIIMNNLRMVMLALRDLQAEAHLRLSSPQLRKGQLARES